MLKVGRNKVVITPMFDDDISKGGIIIPDVAKERCDQGIVKYIGEDVHDLEVGDYVLFSGYSGTTVRLEDEGIVIIMHEDFITCKIEPPETEVSGLYFRDTDGVYWTATYEMAIDLIRRSVQEARDVQIANRKTKPHRIQRGG